MNNWTMPKSILTCVLRPGNTIQAETAMTAAEIRAAMKVGPDEDVEIKTVNTGTKTRQEPGHPPVVLYHALNEVISFKRGDVVFHSIAEAEKPSDLILPRPGLVNL